jgi:hypothetical protein
MVHELLECGDTTGTVTPVEALERPTNDLNVLPRRRLDLTCFRATHPLTAIPPTQGDHPCAHVRRSTRGNVAAEVPRRSRVLKRRVAAGLAARSAKQPGLRCPLPRRLAGPGRPRVLGSRRPGPATARLKKGEPGCPRDARSRPTHLLGLTWAVAAAYGCGTTRRGESHASPALPRGAHRPRHVRRRRPSRRSARCRSGASRLRAALRARSPARTCPSRLRFRPRAAASSSYQRTAANRTAGRSASPSRSFQRSRRSRHPIPSST